MAPGEEGGPETEQGLNMCCEVMMNIRLILQIKTLKTAVIRVLHTGHSDTVFEQLAQRQR